MHGACGDHIRHSFSREIFIRIRYARFFFFFYDNVFTEFETITGAIPDNFSYRIIFATEKIRYFLSQRSFDTDVDKCVC